MKSREYWRRGLLFIGFFLFLTTGLIWIVWVILQHVWPEIPNPNWGVIIATAAIFLFIRSSFRIHRTLRHESSAIAEKSLHTISKREEIQAEYIHYNQPTDGIKSELIYFSKKQFSPKEDTEDNPQVVGEIRAEYLFAMEDKHLWIEQMKSKQLSEKEILEKLKEMMRKRKDRKD